MGWSILHSNGCVVSAYFHCFCFAAASVFCCYLEILVVDAGAGETILETDRIVGK